VLPTKWDALLTDIYTSLVEPALIGGRSLVKVAQIGIIRRRNSNCTTTPPPGAVSHRCDEGSGVALKTPSRTQASHRGLTMDNVNSGEWERILKPAKHKYVWIEGSERRRMLRLLNSDPLPYPKR
jgi:hypothetical protein